ncbi:hypothetical protein, partial [Dokdonella sp.]|uniref:hypothetical protein n=1 Tax=Dokdonella sp. TaxID=2291710 RepID=UPI003C6EB4F4
MKGNFVRVFDLDTGAVRWTLPNELGTSVLLLQLDADPALEMVLDGFQLRVIDGATQALEWVLDEGWHTCCLVAGSYLGPGAQQFAAARRGGSDVSVVRSNPFAFVWTAYRPRVPAMGTVDVDGDGSDELVLGQDQWGDLQVRNGSDGQLLRTFPNGGYAINAISGARISGAARESIAYSPSMAISEQHELFRVIDGLSGVTQWEILNDRAGAYSSVALSDLNDDGRPVFLFAATGAGSVYGAISEMDAMTGNHQWQSPPHPPATTNFPYSFNPYGLGVARRQGLAPLIIAAGSSHSDGRLTAVDGESHGVHWEIGAASTGPLLQRPISQMTIFDIDSDGNDEIFVCTIAAHAGIDPVSISAFSGENGAQLWTSPGMDGGGFPFLPACKDLLVGVFGDNESPQIVAVLPASVEAFDGLTHEHTWSLSVAAEGAA